MKKMKKIVHITQSMEVGGAEMLICNLACLCSEKYDVTVICQYHKIAPQFKKLFDKFGVKVILLNKSPGLSFSAFVELYKALKEIKPDIVHTHLQSGAYAVLYYMFGKKCRRIHTVHSMPKMEATSFHMMMQFFSYKFLNVIPVAIGDVVHREIIKIYKLKSDNVKLIYNGTDTKKFSVKNRHLNENPNIICVANFSPWKNQSMLLKAFSKLNKNTFLTLVGSGECEKSLKDECKKLSIDNRVKFAGRVSDVENYLKNADIFVLCSSFEGIPISILEAFSSGLPVVATNVGGIPDLVKNNVNGFLVKLNDYNDMAVKINNLMVNENLYYKISENNVEKAKEFDISNMIKKYIDVYENY